eukprot:CAMPEP_0172306586 /NCGR_PEP_ID=MMETSP1058-20130122/7633_1 /TAXON_ID=83371 /ORGANISM="Detonula confervacea, Strain CCMP 353" /LENGTH=163 /DNA_ID=CAMNT_0013018523 /DNA_START=79 /DNA_END=570 /DNA_ORIENTATION=+
MKLVSILVAAASVASTSAFMPATKAPQSTQLKIATKGLTGPVRKSIAGITKDNFSATLAEIEPFLTKEAGVTLYNKSLRRIATKAKDLGVEVPANYAKDAKCTEKRREKQNAYCVAKTEEAAAAAAEAAEEAAAATAAAAEEAAAAAAAPAEETPEEEAPAAE